LHGYEISENDIIELAISAVIETARAVTFPPNTLPEAMVSVLVEQRWPNEDDHVMEAAYTATFVAYSACDVWLGRFMDMATCLEVEFAGWLADDIKLKLRAPSLKGIPQ
jgi:hypothetical protein